MEESLAQENIHSSKDEDSPDAVKLLKQDFLSNSIDLSHRPIKSTLTKLITITTPQGTPQLVAVTGSSGGGKIPIKALMLKSNKKIGNTTDPSKSLQENSLSHNKESEMLEDSVQLLDQKDSVDKGDEVMEVKQSVSSSNGLLHENSKTMSDISGFTVLQERKSPNASSQPPPLHPISEAKLHNVSDDEIRSTDIFSINENSDSAVITPIPMDDDASHNEKRRKKISNILRTNSKRMKLNTTQFSQETSNFDSSSNYVIEDETFGNDEETTKDSKKNGSDDDVTLIKVVTNEENKKIRSLSLDEEAKIEIIKTSSSRSDTSGESRVSRSNFKSLLQSKHFSSKSDQKHYGTTIQNYNGQSDSFDASTILDWKDGVGSLPGSSLKFSINEFGFMEIVDEKDNKKKDNSLRISGDKENVCVSKSPPQTACNQTSSRFTPMIKPPKDDTFYCCLGCGCYGLASEFESPESCGPQCTEYLEALKAEKLRKEKELNKELKAKKKRKKLLQEQLSNQQDQYGETDLNINFNYDEYLKDRDEKYEKPLSQNSNSSRVKVETDEDTKDTNILLPDEEPQDVPFRYPWQRGKAGFSWAKYLEYTKSKAAPTNRFKDPFPYSRNNFKVGMKLEGIDPHYPSHFCVLTVAEIIGYRLRLHFDGYPENFDFWVNADSMDIFPVGWAEKNGRKVQPPKGYLATNFNWNAYLKACKATAAPKNLFSQIRTNAVQATSFRIGMKIEAVDKKHSSQICVASISDIMDSRILVHFDSWDDVYDYWVDPSSPYVHPVGWCRENNRTITPPNFYKDAKSFSWDKYLSETGAVAAPARAFRQRAPMNFKKGMKLEAVDKRLPQLIRVATIEDVKNHQIKIRFDGWPENHAYWVDDDSLDIHPMGWCNKTYHPLEPPLVPEQINQRPECGTYGCRGLGHIKGPKFATHNTASGCPYSAQNLHKIKTTIDRLNSRYDASINDDFEEEYFNEEKVKLEKPEKRISDDDAIMINLGGHKYNFSSLNLKNFKLKTGEERERFFGKWKKETNSEDEDTKKRKKRKPHHEELRDSIASLSYDPLTNRNNTAIVSDKQLKLELYQSVYNPGYNPLPDAPHVWAKHSNALNRIISKQNTNPRRWSNEEVIKFIQSVPNCKDIGSVFRKQSIDGEAFLMLTQEDLVSILGLRLGPAIKLYNSIVLLRKKAS